jgi:hypothetical protein
MRPGRLFVVLDENFCGLGDVAANRAKTIGARKNLRRVRDL